MNVYFTASIVGKKQHLKNYLKIIDILKKKGYKIQSDHIINKEEKDIRLESKDKRLAFHNQLEKWISRANFMVVEASFPSISVGYEISLALHYRKPVLILYSENDPPSLFAYHNNQYIVCEQYSLDSLSGIIVDFVNYIQGTADSRFIFFVTPQIAAFLDQMALKHKVPKSVYLRTILQREMAKDTSKK